MTLINLRRDGFIGFFVVLLTIIVFFALSESGSNKFVAAQENRAEETIEKLKTENPDAYRANAVSQTLSRLFADKAVNFDEAKLLPNRVEGTKILRVSFEPMEKNLSGEFSEQKSNANLLRQNQSRTSDAPLSRQRAFELSLTQILIVSTDEEKRILWWDLQPDPRIFHAEAADDNGVLSGKTVYRQNAEILINIPDAKEISDLYFYSPNWDGKIYSLELIGNLKLNNPAQSE